MTKQPDNIFEIGLLYQAIISLRELREKTIRYKQVQYDLERIIKKLKAALQSEIESL